MKSPHPVLVRIAAALAACSVLAPACFAAGKEAPAVRLCAKSGSSLKLTRVDAADYVEIERCDQAGTCTALAIVPKKTIVWHARAAEVEGVRTAVADLALAGGVIAAGVYASAYAALVADAYLLPAGIHTADDVLFLVVTGAGWAGSVGVAEKLVELFDPAGAFQTAKALKAVAKGSPASANACAVTLSNSDFQFVAGQLVGYGNIMTASTSDATTAKQAPVSFKAAASSAVDRLVQARLQGPVQ